jgi:hypothetical protein
MANNEEKDSQKYVMFVDVLYAVVVGETIFSYGKELFSYPPTLATFALVVTYISIISSFMFWHNAISKFPHEKPYRFFVDIFVLVTYLGIVFNHQNIDALFLGFVILYSLYLIWDYLTIREYNKDVSRLKTSLINLGVVFTFCVIRLLLSYWQISATEIDVVFLSLIVTFIVVSQLRDIMHVQQLNHQPKGNSLTEKANQPKR